MRLLAGLFCLVLGALWLLRMHRRDRARRTPAQALLDFLTGAPIESVLCIGLIVFGLLLIAAAMAGSE